jgi:hypothetical protein
MDWARKRHEPKTHIEQLALVLWLQMDRQKSKFPAPTHNHCSIAHKENCLASTWWLLEPQIVWINCSKGSLGNHAALFPLYPPNHEAPCWLIAYPDRQEHQSLNYKDLRHIEHSSPNWPHPISNHNETTWTESLLIVSRSFQTQPFFQKCHFTDWNMLVITIIKWPMTEFWKAGF